MAPLENYGLHVGYPLSFVAETDGRSPHLQLYYTEDRTSSSNTDTVAPKFRAAINIKSSTPKESRLMYKFIRGLDHPVTARLSEFKPGFHPKDMEKEFPSLDYIRDNIFTLATGSLLRHDLPGEKNDIIDFLGPVLNEAIKRKAVLYIFGQQFPGGIHDVHMNQGNEGRFAKDNWVHQDGGLLLHFEDDGHWEGVFLAFGVQKVHTKDTDGSPIGKVDFVALIEGGGRPGRDNEGSVEIRGAILNPVGPDQAPTTGDSETVYLVNTTTQDVDLTGWAIMNKSRNRQELDGVLKADEKKAFLVPKAPLSNQGGTISLLDGAGLKVHGVSYSKEQASREGVLVLF